jgi:hypothetical protein
MTCLSRILLAGLLFSFVSILAGSAQTPSAAGTFDGPAELPRLHVKSSLADTPAPGKVRMVHAGDNLEEAFSQASCGDTLKLEAGSAFTGHFVLPAKHCDDAHWIIIRTSAPDSALPLEGTRLTPCYAGVASLPGRPEYPCPAAKNVLARIEYPKKGRGPLEFADGANHYRLLGLEITRSASTDSVSNLVTIEGQSKADHLVFDRVWIHGTAQSETTRGIGLGGSTDVAVVDSYFTDLHCIAKTGACTDAQAIGGGLGSNVMGPYKIENNFLEASGEDVMFGGGNATSVPHDIVIRRNHMFRPLTWMRDNPGFVGGADGHPFIVKNIFELKSGERVLFEDNVLENSWGGFSQEGYAILLTPRNQEPNRCPECRVVDVTIRNVRISNVGAGFQIANVKSDVGDYAKDGGRYSIHNVLVENLDGQRFQGHGVMFEILSTKVILHDLSIDHVTGQANRALFMVGAHDGKIVNFTFTNNLLSAGKQQILLANGGPENCAYRPEVQGPAGVFDSCFTNSKVAGNVIIGGSNKWPAKNSLVKNAGEVGFKAADKELVSDYRLHPSSRYKNAGTDQKDVGADVDGINAATKDVL